MIVEIFRIGAAAVEALSTAPEGIVQGVTSRGAFLRVEDRIIYLTALDYLSPFNLTLAGGDQRFERLAPGDKFSIDTNKLHFQTRKLTVFTGNAEVWTPPLPVKIISNPVEQYERALLIAKQLRQIDSQKGYLFLSKSEHDIDDTTKLTVMQSASAILSGYKQESKAGFLRGAAALIGSGGGLTPSGDDFLTGFLLYHFRRELSDGVHSEFLGEWREEISTLAFKKTTTISANRIMFTERGWSEDIFLNLIDHLFDPGVPFSDKKIHLLMEIGHSSGVDTFMGILYAIKSLI